MASAPATGETRRVPRVPVFLVFYCSGAVGLILEVVWTRILGTVFGNTVFAASTVLTAFMLGLALGSVVLGRVAERVRRPLVLYGCLELGVGLSAFLFPLLTAVCNALYGWFFRAFDPGFPAISAVRFVLSLAVLLPPCFLMGGTLPVLGHYLGRRHEEPSREVGYLYAINTFGAVTGCFVAGFVLLEVLGVRGSLFAAGGIALGIGLLAVALGRSAAAPVGKKRRHKKPKEAIAEPVETLPAGADRLLLIGFAIAGFCSLAYEVLWTRVLLFVLATSLYSFATMLTTFLVGIAAGSFLSSRFLAPRVGRPLLWFGVVEVLVGLTALLSVPLLAKMEAIDYRFLGWFAGMGDKQVILARFADAFVVMLAPTLLMGIAFPLVFKACLRDGRRIGRDTGQVYAANTIGCVLGSFAAGFILLPLLKTHLSLLLVVALNFAVGIAFVWKEAARTRGARLALAAPFAAVAVTALVFVPSDIFYRTINAYHHPSKITYIKEHPTGTVTVHEFPTGERLIAVDGVDVAGTNFMLRSTQKLQGYIPLILHPDPNKVVQIGFGSGETARVGLEFGVPDYTVVEICPAVREADDLFTDVNGGSNRDERIRWVIMDGKNFALLSNEKFDIVMNDSIYPGSSGSSALYTADHFRHCRDRLAEGGLFSCWVPIDLRPRELRMILRSFQEVFPHTSFWLASNCLNKHALILGTLEPLRIDFQRIEEVLQRPDIAADLKAIAIENAHDFLECFMCDEKAIAELTKDDPMNTDDRPRLEISCAAPEASEKRLLNALAQLTEYRTPVTPYVVNLPEEEKTRAEMRRRFEATTHIFRAHVAQLLGYPDARQRDLERALAANPGERHVQSCQNELFTEIEDLRAAMKIEKLEGNPVLSMRLADKLTMAAYVPGGGVDAGMGKEAAALYEKMIGRNPSLPAPVHVRLAQLHFDLNQREEAQRVVQRTLRVWPRCAEAHSQMARIHFESGRRDLALQSMERAIRLAPDDPVYKKRRETILNSKPPAAPLSRGGER